VQGALIAKSPSITHQSPEHAPPIPYLNILPFYTNSQIDSRNPSVESGLQGNIFGKRQREEDENGGASSRQKKRVEASVQWKKEKQKR
jgi:hypothetical protein